MANHEVTYKCQTCGLDYDARLHGAICPECQSVNSTPANRRRQGLKTLFHISDAALIGAGFVKSECFDRDLSDFDNVKVVTFAKEIVSNLRIEYCFYFYAENPAQFELKESTSQLILGDEDLLLKLNDFASTLRFTDTLIKTLKPVIK